MKLKKLRIRGTGFCLALLLFAGQSTGAFAADGRFAEPKHGQLSFAEMKYEETNAKECEALAKQIRTLTKDAAKAKRVVSLFEDLLEAYDYAAGMGSLAMVLSDLDTESDYYRKESERLGNLDTELSELLRETAETVLQSPCGEYAESVWGEELCEAARETALTPEQKKLTEQENRLLAEYEKKSAAEYTAEWKGKQITLDEMDELYDEGTLSGTEWNELYKEILKNENAALGPIFLELVTIRNRYAETEGMDNYLDYAYESYMRSYTTEDTSRMAELAEQILIPLEEKLPAVTDEDGLDEYAEKHLDPETGMKLTVPYLKEIAPELDEAYQYMEEHGLYDLEYDENKTAGAYTIGLPSEHSLFLFSQPDGYFTDFSTFIHEFGHFSQMYWTEPYHSWPYVFNVDLAEVHSQGLELLFLDYYDAMLGEWGGTGKKLVLRSLIESITGGFATDQLEQYAYENPDVTLEEFNEYAGAVRAGFGYEPEWSAYDWVETSHIYETPGYYISYATSAIAAFELWEEALEDRDEAVGDYLTLVEFPQAPLDEMLKQCGLSTPYESGILNTIRRNVERETGIFPDSYGIWSEPYIDALSYYSVDTGHFSEDGSLYFDPEAPITRGEFVSLLCQAAERNDDGVSKAAYNGAKGRTYENAILWACSEGIVEEKTKDEFRPYDLVSRQDMAVMTAAFTERYDTALPGAGGRTVPFKDQKQIEDYALDAVLTLRKEGVLVGYPDKTFAPERHATREEAAAVVSKLLL